MTATEDDIRRDERHKIAAMLEEHADTLTTFTGDDSTTVRLIVFMLQLDAPGVARMVPS